MIGMKGVESYKNLITSEHKNAPKFMDWLERNLHRLNAAYEIIEAVTGSFNIDTAEGLQLDTLGKLIGASRVVDFIPTGYTTSILLDDHYRILLKSKIIKNMWKGQLDFLAEAWEVLFEGCELIVSDNQDMTMTVGIFGDFDVVIRELITNGYIVPKVQSVQINFNFGDLPTFGYDINNDYISGYNIGYWAA